MLTVKNGIDFRRMRFLINRLPMAQFRLLKAKSQATRITPVLSDMPHGTAVSSPVENGYQLIEAAEEAVYVIRMELATMQETLLKHFDPLKDPLEEQTMRMRYLEGRSVREIAYSLNYSERRIFQVLNAAERRVNETFH